jgi:hypothetical protein
MTSLRPDGSVVALGSSSHAEACVLPLEDWPNSKRVAGAGRQLVTAVSERLLLLSSKEGIQAIDVTSGVLAPPLIATPAYAYAIDGDLRSRTFAMVDGTNGMVCKVDETSDTISVMAHLNEDGLLGGVDIVRVIESGRKVLAVNTLSGALRTFDGRSGGLLEEALLSNIIPDPHGDPAGIVISVVVDPQSDLWFVTVSNGLACWMRTSPIRVVSRVEVPASESPLRALAASWDGKQIAVTRFVGGAVVCIVSFQGEQPWLQRRTIDVRSCWQHSRARRCTSALFSEGTNAVILGCSDGAVLRCRLASP